MSEENVEVARRIMEAWSQRDAETTIELLHEEIEWHPYLTAGGAEGVVFRGPSGMRQWFAQLDEVWSELSLRDVEFRDPGGDRVLQLGRFHAVGKESGVPVDQPQAILFEFKDGNPIRARGFGSHQEALEAAGLTE